jgi:hypothetical protein
VGASVFALSCTRNYPSNCEIYSTNRVYEIEVFFDVVEIEKFEFNLQKSDVDKHGCEFATGQAGLECRSQLLSSKKEDSMLFQQ